MLITCDNSAMELVRTVLVLYTTHYTNTLSKTPSCLMFYHITYYDGFVVDRVQPS